MLINGAPPTAAAFAAAQRAQWVGQVALAQRLGKPEPFPGVLRLLDFQVNAACRDIGTAKRAEWAAEGMQGLQAVLAAHPELRGA